MMKRRKRQKVPPNQHVFHNDGFLSTFDTLLAHGFLQQLNLSCPPLVRSHEQFKLKRGNLKKKNAFNFESYICECRLNNHSEVFPLVSEIIVCFHNILLSKLKYVQIENQTKADLPLSTKFRSSQTYPICNLLIPSLVFTQYWQFVFY